VLGAVAGFTGGWVARDGAATPGGAEPFDWVAAGCRDDACAAAAASRSVRSILARLS
jgi:hypothetical protein